MVMFPEKPALAMAEAAAVNAPPTACGLSDRLSILRKTFTLRRKFTKYAANNWQVDDGWWL